MALLTTLEKLENVQTAIALAESAQRYRIGAAGGGREVERANLDVLYRREQYLTDLLADEDGTTPYVSLIQPCRPT